MAVLAQMGEFDFDQSLGLVEFLDGGDHRKHHADFAAAAGAQQRAHLAAQQAGAIQSQADRAPAERRVLFLEIALIRWMPAYIRLLSYFSNFILLASFLGIGLGCLLAPARFRLKLANPLGAVHIIEESESAIPAEHKVDDQLVGVLTRLVAISRPDADDLVLIIPDDREVVSIPPDVTGSY